MVNGAPLFTGNSEDTQLDTIFRQLGTPDEISFPGIVDLPDWKPFPIYSCPDSIQHLVPNLGAAGVDLLNSMLIYDPYKRITAQEARRHHYFDDLPESFRNVGDRMH